MVTIRSCRPDDVPALSRISRAARRRRDVELPSPIDEKVDDTALAERVRNGETKLIVAEYAGDIVAWAVTYQAGPAIATCFIDPVADVDVREHLIDWLGRFARDAGQSPLHVFTY